VTDVVLFLHIVGALAFVSGIVVAGVAFESARRRADPGEISLLLGLSRIGVLLVVAGGAVVFICGLWLVGLGDFSFGDGWISAAIALFFITLALGAFGGQRPKEARILATQLARDGRPASPELREMLDERRSANLNYLAAAIVVAILALMVFKP
jgi:uncharacterized membrane protein